MTTRINNRGFNFGNKSREDAIVVALAHPWAMFEVEALNTLSGDVERLVADQQSVISYIEDLPAEQVHMTLY